MSKTKSDTVRVKKTDNLDQRKLNAIARKYGIPPISVRELQLGFTEDVPRAAAEKLERDGFVTVVKSKPRSPQTRADSLSVTTELTEPLALSAESKIEDLDGDSNSTTGDAKEQEEELNADNV